jgi:two-component system CheB/CheR fusion protein
VPRGTNGGNGFAAGQALGVLGGEPSGLDRLRSEAFLASPVAQVVVTADGLVALCNRQAEQVFGVSARDIGRPFRDLELSFRPVELRSDIERVQLERRPVRIKGVEYGRPPEAVYLDVEVEPLSDNGAALLGVTLIFKDVTAAHRLQLDLEQANQQLESAYEELQSTVEELETTNEELQSTNEELETMNEELHSTNDELQTINDELRRRTDELDRANGFLEAILGGLRAGVAVLDLDMTVRAWNNQAENLWGLRRDEALGQHFLNLDIGLPTDLVRPLVRQAVADNGGVHQTTLTAINRRGRETQIRVSCTSLRSSTGSGEGAILLMEVDAPDGHTPT